MRPIYRSWPSACAWSNDRRRPAGFPTLDAVAHYFGGHVPVDPFTGEPFRYVPGQDGFRLYSVGGNLKDDGGEEKAHADIVWRNKAGF